MRSREAVRADIKAAHEHWMILEKELSDICDFDRRNDRRDQLVGWTQVIINANTLTKLRACSMQICDLVEDKSMDDKTAARVRELIEVRWQELRFPPSVPVR